VVVSLWFCTHASMLPSSVVAHAVKHPLHAVVSSESAHLDFFSAHSEKQFANTSSAMH
jgi:hypothetical protein